MSVLGPVRASVTVPLADPGWPGLLRGDAEASGA